jgi:hypothetical protein
VREGARGEIGRSQERERQKGGGDRGSAGDGGGMDGLGEEEWG